MASINPFNVLPCSADNGLLVPPVVTSFIISVYNILLLMVATEALSASVIIAPDPADVTSFNDVTENEFKFLRLLPKVDI